MAKKYQVAAFVKMVVETDEDIDKFMSELSFGNADIKQEEIDPYDYNEITDDKAQADETE